MGRSHRRKQGTYDTHDEVRIDNLSILRGNLAIFRRGKVLDAVFANESYAVLLQATEQSPTELVRVYGVQRELL